MFGYNCPFIYFKHTPNEIIKYNSQGFGFSNEFLLGYINYLKFNDRWYGSYCCLTRGYYQKGLKILFQYLIPTKDILLSLCKYSAAYDVFFMLFKHFFQL